VPPEELLTTCEAVIKLHRDHGNRTNRDHARLKYVIDDLGDDRVREIVGDYLGGTLRDAEPVVLHHADDHLGWHTQGDGAWFLGVKVANGRIADVGDERVRSGLRVVVEQFGASVRFTAREDVLLCNVAASDRGAVDEALARHGVRPAEEWAPVARNSFACPALPTCGLALAESERALPAILDELHVLLTDVGLGDLCLAHAHDRVPQRLRPPVQPKSASCARKESLRRSPPRGTRWRSGAGAALGTEQWVRRSGDAATAGR
jgi:sulfite reductase (ferredoxin)